jgi:hypothetical protein
MNDKTNTWADSWASSQQALMKTMFPASMPGVANAAGIKTPLEKQFSELRDTWKESMEKWARLASESPDVGAWTTESLCSLFNPANWSGTGAFDAGLRQVIDGPKYAVLFDLDRKLLMLRQLAVQRDKDVADFQGMMTSGWNEAFKRFSTSLSSANEEVPATWRGMADRWLSIVNDTFIEIHRSESFIEAQRRMLRSASDYRLQEREIAEVWCEAFHIPTRTEMDEMQRTVSELKRRLRAMRRSSGAPPAVNEVDAPSPGKRISESKPSHSTRT